DTPVSLRVGNLTHEDFAGLWSNILIHHASFEFDGLTKDNAPAALEPLLTLQKEAIDSADLASLSGFQPEAGGAAIASLPVAANRFQSANFVGLEPASEPRFTVRSGGRLVIQSGTVAIDSVPGQPI